VHGDDERLRFFRVEENGDVHVSRQARPTPGELQVFIMLHH